MTNYNGANAHNVESILASIRSTIGEDADHAASSRRPARPARSEHSDETLDFDLPAIFRPGHSHSVASTPEGRARLLDKIGEALTPDAFDKTGTVVRFDPANAGRMIEPPAPVSAAPVATPQPQPDAPRQMASFKDTRMSRMGAAPPAATAEPVAPTPVATAPPPLPDRASPGGEGVTLDDAAAQMLRPILRQWLSDNMPKIVEKALRSEASGDFPASPPDATPRKTLR